MTEWTEITPKRFFLNFFLSTSFFFRAIINEWLRKSCCCTAHSRSFDADGWRQVAYCATRCAKVINRDQLNGPAAASLTIYTQFAQLFSHWDDNEDATPQRNTTILMDLCQKQRVITRSAHRDTFFVVCASCVTGVNGDWSYFNPLKALFFCTEKRVCVSVLSYGVKEKCFLWFLVLCTVLRRGAAAQNVSQSCVV